MIHVRVCGQKIVDQYLCAYLIEGGNRMKVMLDKHEKILLYEEEKASIYINEKLEKKIEKFGDLFTIKQDTGSESCELEKSKLKGRLQVTENFLNKIGWKFEEKFQAESQSSNVLDAVRSAYYDMLKIIRVHFNINQDDFDYVILLDNDLPYAYFRSGYPKLDIKEFVPKLKEDLKDRNIKKFPPENLEDLGFEDLEPEDLELEEDDEKLSLLMYDYCLNFKEKMQVSIYIDGIISTSLDTKHVQINENSIMKVKKHESENIEIEGIMQLSNDSLEQIGWKYEKDLQGDNQSKEEIDNVRKIYKKTIDILESHLELSKQHLDTIFFINEGLPYAFFSNISLFNNKAADETGADDFFPNDAKIFFMSTKDGKSKLEDPTKKIDSDEKAYIDCFYIQELYENFKRRKLYQKKKESDLCKIRKEKWEAKKDKVMEELRIIRDELNKFEKLNHQNLDELIKLKNFLEEYNLEVKEKAKRKEDELVMS